MHGKVWLHLESLGAVAVIDLVAEAGGSVWVVAGNPLGRAQEVLECGANCGGAPGYVDIIRDTLQITLQRLRVDGAVSRSGWQSSAIDWFDHSISRARLYTCLLYTSDAADE